jgi:hypothetical protein
MVQGREKYQVVAKLQHRPPEVRLLTTSASQASTTWAESRPQRASRPPRFIRALFISAGYIYTP